MHGHPYDLIATIDHAMGIDPATEYHDTPQPSTQTGSTRESDCGIVLNSAGGQINVAGSEKLLLASARTIEANSCQLS